MINTNEVFQNYDREFIRTVESCDLEEVQSLVNNAPEQPYIKISDQSSSISTGYQIIYKHLADSEEETLNTSIQVLVYLGQYLGCKTKDFMRVVKDYCNRQVDRVFEDSNGNPDKSELLKLQQMMREADNIINSSD